MLAGVRPEEIADCPVTPGAALTFAASLDAQAQAVEQAVELGRRVAARGGDAVVLIDGSSTCRPRAARRALAAGRNLADGGSLTVIATSPAPVGGETTVDRAGPRGRRARARSRRSPAASRARCAPELLVGEAGVEAMSSAAARWRVVAPAAGARGRGRAPSRSRRPRRSRERRARSPKARGEAPAKAKPTAKPAAAKKPQPRSAASRRRRPPSRRPRRARPPRSRAAKTDGRGEEARREQAPAAEAGHEDGRAAKKPAAAAKKPAAAKLAEQREGRGRGRGPLTRGRSAASSPRAVGDAAPARLGRELDRLAVALGLDVAERVRRRRRRRRPARPP